MPDRVGGGNSIIRNLFGGGGNNVSETTHTTDVGGAQPGAGNTTANPTGNDGFEVAANTGNAPAWDPFVEEGLYHDLGNASGRARTNGKVEIGTYNDTSRFHILGGLNRDANNTTADWNNRFDWKGNTNQATQGLGTSRGPRTDNSNSSALKVGGLWLRDDKIGAQAKASGDLVGRYGSASGSARVYSELGLKRVAEYGITKTGITAGATLEARAVAAGAEVSGKISSPSVRVGGQDLNVNADVFGRATVEANASVSGNVAFDRDPPKAVLTGKAGAFAGAKAYGRARFGIGDIFKVGVYGEGWAGAGAEASGTAGYENGKFSLGGSVGAGLGLGGKLGVRVDVDVIKAAQLAKDVADVDRDGKLTLNDGASAVTKSADAAMTGVEQGVDKTLNALDADNDGRFSRRDLGLHASRLQRSLHNVLDANNDGKLGFNDVGAAARNVGQGIAQGAEAVGRGVAQGAEAVGRGAQAVGRAAHNLADVNNDGKLGLDDAGIAARAVGRGVAQGAEAVGRGVVAGAEAVGRGAQAVGRAAHNLADVNNDGKLGLNDVGAAAQNVGRGIAQGAEAVGRGAQAVGRAAHNLADANNDGKLGLNDVGAAARNVGRGVARGAEAVGRTAHNLADANNDGKLGLDDVGAAARNVGRGVAEGAEAVGRGISRGAEAVGRGAEAVGRGAASVGRSIANQASKAADTLTEGASRTYNRAKGVVNRVSSFFGW